MNRRPLKWGGAILLAVLAVLVLAVVIVMAVANVGPGRRLIEREAASLSGGMVRIDGLAGRFPDALRVGWIWVSDAKGPYLTISGLVLDWSPLKLIGGTVQIDLLGADRLDFSRLPEPRTSPSGGTGSFTLPVGVDLRHLHIDRAVIGAPVAGSAATLALDGSASVSSLTAGTVRLVADRLDSAGRYAVDAHVTPTLVQATITADEPAKGLISGFAHLPDLGAIVVRGSVSGPRDALGTRVEVTAGALSASVSGTVDLDHQAADLAVKAQAPAMAPAPGVAWRSVLVDATVDGAFARPRANGAIRIDSLTAGGARIGALDADIKGNAGQVDLHATVTGLHVPGPKPDLFAADPVTLAASVRLDAPDRPVTFAVHHPLVSLEGAARTEGVRQVQAHLVLADLSPLAAAGGTALSGRADLDLAAAMKDGTTTATVKGRISVTGGMAPVPELIGADGRIDLAASLFGRDLTLSHLSLNGKALAVSAKGGLADGAVDLNWTVALADLAAIQPSLSGRLDAKGHAGGTLDDLSVQAALDADLAAKGYSGGHITAAVKASGLPRAPHASVDASGMLLDAPLNLALTADEANGSVQVTIGQASWKSVRAGGALRLAPPAMIPAGDLHIGVGRLKDLAPLLGRPISGVADATLESDARAAKLGLTITDLMLPGMAAIGKAVLGATVTDPTGNPVIDGTLTADGVSAGGAKSITARVSAKGPLDAVGVAVAAHAPSVGGGAAELTAGGVLNARDRTLELRQLEASWKQQVLRLLVPARLRFADGVAIERLRLGFRRAVLTVAGSVGRTLDLTATLRDLPADIGAIFDPAFAANGTIGADVRLSGTSTRPQGTIKLTALGVRQRQGPGQALPAANLLVTATLLGTAARIDTKLTAGGSHVTLTGSVPLSAGGALDLKTDGRLDLAMLDPLLMARGRRARGAVALNATVSGTTAAPLVRGSAQLTKGDIVDYALGAQIHDLTATIEASGDTIGLTHFAGKAGPGSVSGSGTIGLAGAMPVDLHFTANNARPLSSDLMTALMDADLTVKGDIKGDLRAGGTLHVRRADIRIPDKMPPSIAVLPVRNADAPPAPLAAAAPVSTIALNLTLDAPQQVFIRGRGLDAEVGGTIHIHGSAAKPIPDGGLHLRRGTLSIVGTTLNFTEGTIDFTGGGLSDPSIHFVASSATAAIVATLTVSGSAKDPKITLSSVPDLPQDEILSQLLFNTSTSKLSPFQLAEIASALASLSGATAGFDPLESLRTTFGLDRLSVGSSGSGSPTLEAGRYLARGVYLGARQSASGAGTQATVQIDLAKGLKLETTAGSGSASATGSASSSDAASVGLTYQFEY